MIQQLREEDVIEEQVTPRQNQEVVVRRSGVIMMYHLSAEKLQLLGGQLQLEELQLDGEMLLQ